MSHNFENGFFVREAAWHKLGVVLENAPQTSQEAILAAGLNWNVCKQSVFLQDGTLVPDTWAMVRDTDNAVLGTVGNRYTALQNSEAFSFFDKLVEDKVATYETAGSLSGGKKVWILAQLPGIIEVGKDDPVKKYVLLSNTHDGSGTVVAKVTPIRVVCNNTLTAALSENAGMDQVTIRHTKTVADRVKQASTLLATVNSIYDDMAKLWIAMTKVEMPPQAIQQFLTEVVPDSEKVENPYKTQRIRIEMLQLMSSSSLGGELSSAQGTLWGAYNGVTAYADHMVSARKDATADKHLNSVWFGDRARLKGHALSVAQDWIDRAGVSL